MLNLPLCCFLSLAALGGGRRRGLGHMLSLPLCCFLSVATMLVSRVASSSGSGTDAPDVCTTSLKVLGNSTSRVRTVTVKRRAAHQRCSAACRKIPEGLLAYPLAIGPCLPSSRDCSQYCKHILSLFHLPLPPQALIPQLQLKYPPLKPSLPSHIPACAADFVLLLSHVICSGCPRTWLVL